MLEKHLRSFGYARKGIARAWREEMNFRIEALAGIAALVLGILLHLSRIEWALIALASAFVLASEAFNTAFEELCDMLRTEHDPHVAKIKDIAAGAVLIAAIGALLVGCFVYLPHLAALFI